MAAKSGIPKAAPKTGPKTVPKQFPKVPGGGRSLSAPPGSPKAPPARQSISRISSPRGRRPPAELGQELTDWGESSGLAEVAVSLISAGVRTLEEVGALTEDDLHTLFQANLDLDLGSRARFRLALRSMRAEVDRIQEADVLSGWVEEGTGIPVPVSAFHGNEVILWEELRVGVMQVPGRGSVRICAALAEEVAGPAELGSPTVPSVSPDFGAAGPLEELASSARQLLRQMGGSEAQSRTLVAPRPSVEPTRPRPSVTVSTPTVPMGRTLSDAQPRAAARPVSLKVTSLQAGAIEEEWTAAGTVRFETAVMSRSWKKGESKGVALALARSLDVGKDSGLDLRTEPMVEVTLRELAALWYADRHPADAETADYLRESSMSQFGIPRALWQEAKEYRKLASGRNLQSSGH